VPVNEPPASVVRFGAFEVDLLAGELRRHGRKLKLPDQPFQVLAILLERPGQVVTRNELQKRLWSADTFVDFDRGLNKAINRVREALGDDADAPRHIETLPKRGYRFIGAIEPVSPVSGVTPAPEVPNAVARGDRTSATGVAPSRSSTQKLLAVTIAVIVLAIPTSMLPYFHGATREESLLRSSILPPSDTSFVPYNFAISPDGTQLIFNAANSDGTDALWLRALSGAAVRRLDGTEGGRFPFWSPDGRHIGFFADRKLKTLNVMDGAIQTICDARRAHGATWSASGIIVFAPDVVGPLYKVATSGGAPTTVTPQSGSRPQSAGWPTFLPDGHHFLYVAREEGEARGQGGTMDVYVASIDAPDAIRIVTGVVGGASYASNHLFFVRDGSIMAQPFSPTRLRTSGSPVPIAEHELETENDAFPPGFSISVDGVLLFQSSFDFASRLMWVDSGGKELGQIRKNGDEDPALSRDGRVLAVSCSAQRDGTRDICLYDLERDVTTHLTHGGKDRHPVWSRDGKTIAYVSGRDTPSRIYEVAVDGSQGPQPVAQLTGIPTDWSPGRDLLFFGPEGNNVALAMYSPSSHERKSLGPGSEGQLSPDGRWILSGGQDGITVRRLTGEGPRVQVAEYGGSQPRWSDDGRQIFYVTGDKKLMRVGFDLSSGQVTAPRILFQTRIVASALVGFQYDVARDGRFIINSLPASSAPFTLISGLSTRLKD